MPCACILDSVIPNTFIVVSIIVELGRSRLLEMNPRLEFLDNRNMIQTPQIHVVS